MKLPEEKFLHDLSSPIVILQLLLDGLHSELASMPDATKQYVNSGKAQRALARLADLVKERREILHRGNAPE